MPVAYRKCYPNATHLTNISKERLRSNNVPYPLPDGAISVFSLYRLGPELVSSLQITTIYTADWILGDIRY